MKLIDIIFWVTIIFNLIAGTLCLIQTKKYTANIKAYMKALNDLVDNDEKRFTEFLKKYQKYFDKVD